MGSETSEAVEVVLTRKNGSAGTIACSWGIEDLTSVPGTDYTLPMEDDCRVVFLNSQITKRIRIPLIDTKAYEKNARFKVVLRDPEGIRAQLSEYSECIVSIVADEETKKLVDTVTK